MPDTSEQNAEGPSALQTVAIFVKRLTNVTSAGLQHLHNSIPKPESICQDTVSGTVARHSAPCNLHPMQINRFCVCPSSEASSGFQNSPLWVWGPDSDPTLHRHQPNGSNWRVQRIIKCGSFRHAARAWQLWPTSYAAVFSLLPGWRSFAWNALVVVCPDDKELGTPVCTHLCMTL